MGTRQNGRTWRWIGAGALLVASAAALPALAAPVTVPVSPYIVQAGSATEAHTVVAGVITTNGGVGAILYDLPLVNGVVANLSATEFTVLEASYAVTPDAAVQTAMSAKGTPPAPAPKVDNVFPAVTGADTVVATGNDGHGVGVAVVDTGIAALRDFGSRLKAGVDLSGENNAHLDSYGHGTFVAGLVAGNGASSRGKYIGEAPGADLVPVKVAGRSGATTLSTLIRGLQWIKDNPSNIKVVNLSIGAVPTGPTALNPLDQAVEAMWRSGFAVVASAGNNGSAAGTITSPGDDPFVITVGALADKHTLITGDDALNAISSRGPTSSDAWWKPDLVAPGTSLVSVTSTSSVIWNSYPTARIGSANFIGTGTSFATAVTSGAAAMLYVDNPTATPDNIKAALLTTTHAGPAPPSSDPAAGGPFALGHGVLDVAKAVAEPPLTLAQSVAGITPPAIGTIIPLVTTQAVSTWSNMGTPAELVAYPVTAVFPYPYFGPATTALDPSNNDPLFHSSSWNSSSWNSSSWNSSSWNSSSWNSSSWNSSSWNSSSWN